MWGRLLVVFLAVGGLSLLMGLSDASGAGTGRGSLPRFRATALPPLPGYQASAANGINDSGEVVGGSGSYMYLSDRATRWDRRGRPFELPTAGDYSEALAINNGGEAVGWQMEAGGQPHACAWKDGVQRLLPELPGPAFSEAVAVNDAGWIVGSCGTGDADRYGFQKPHAVLWRDGTILDLGTFGGLWSRANAINKDGWIVGEASTGAEEEEAYNNSAAFLWREGEMIRLPAPPQRIETMATDINDRGEIVGGALVKVNDGSGTSAPPLEWWEFTLWRAETVSSSRRTAGFPRINSKGTVVDWWTGDVKNVFFGFLLTEGRVASLRSRVVPKPAWKDWPSSAPRDINDSGQVVGWKMDRYYEPMSVSAFRLDPLPSIRPKRWDGR